MKITKMSSLDLRGVDLQIFTDFRKKLEKRARGQRAPWKCVEAVEIACREPFEVGDKFEQQTFVECLASPQRAALTHLFNAERTARKIPGLEDVKPLPIRRARRSWAHGSICTPRSSATAPACASAPT